MNIEVNTSTYFIKQRKVIIHFKVWLKKSNTERGRIQYRNHCIDIWSNIRFLLRIHGPILDRAMRLNVHAD